MPSDKGGGDWVHDRLPISDHFQQRADGGCNDGLLPRHEPGHILCPSAGEQRFLLGQLQFQAALVLFLVLNGHCCFCARWPPVFSMCRFLIFRSSAVGTMAAMEQMARSTRATAFDCGTTQRSGTAGACFLST